MKHGTRSRPPPTAPHGARIDSRTAMAGHLIGLALLREAAGVLARAGVELLPLKGIWLQQLVYASPADRPITDVDVLVRSNAFEPAVTALEQAGFRMRSRDVGEACLVRPDYPLSLDLHRSLFTRFAFALAAEDLFARGTPDHARFGVALVLPDPLDVFAHLVGHFVKSRKGPLDVWAQRDFSEIASRFALEPVECARRLEATGLARAARYVFSHRPAADFGAAVVRALGPDPLGDTLARALVDAACRLPQGSPALALSSYLLDRSLGAGLLALGARVGDKLAKSLSQ